ncbi:MAG: hypothetical protein J7647_30935 [Cyanobacteria bacterium SBLK]|nr:hypothetical protein [Cyanobacteria bacterium SBLK]
MTMERSEIVKKLWYVAQQCLDDDGNVNLFEKYVAHSTCSPPDTWILQPGDPIWIDNREGIISRLIAENMNDESRSKITVIFDGTYSERIFKTKKILTKENSDSFVVIQGNNEVIVRRNDCFVLVQDGEKVEALGE